MSAGGGGGGGYVPIVTEQASEIESSLSTAGLRWTAHLEEILDPQRTMWNANA